MLPIPNLKKKRKEQEVEKGEVVHLEAKKQKMAQDKGRASSVESRFFSSCLKEEVWVGRGVGVEFGRVLLLTPHFATCI